MTHHRIDDETKPEDCQIYSPEASDFSPYGDWQTKAVLGLLVIAGIGCILLLWKVW